MFVASYARLPPGSRFHLSVNVQIFPCKALYRVFAVTIWVGSDRLLQCAAPPRVPPRYRSGPPLQCAVPPQYRSGPLYYSARYRLGTASVPLGPSITMRGTASVPLRYRSGPLLQCAVPPRYRSGPLLQCAVPPRYRSGPPLQCAVSPRYRSGLPLRCAVPPRYRSGPLLQCAVPPRYRFGTARALYYNARYRHPVCVLQSFNWIGVRNFQGNTKTNRKPRNATLTL